MIIGYLDPWGKIEVTYRFGDSRQGAQGDLRIDWDVCTLCSG